MARSTRQPIAVVLALMLAAALAVPGCGSESADVAVEPAPTATPARPEPTAIPKPTAIPEPTATAQPTVTSEPTATPELTAAAALAGFFEAADKLDGRIKDAATVFNAGLDSDAVTLDPGVAPVVDALDARPLRALIPAGLSADLERAVLAVYADLDGRISALEGAVRNIQTEDNLQWGFDCLANGGRSAARFPADLALAHRLADAEPTPTALPDSEVAGVMAVRLEAIRGMNWCCDSCGGVEYDAAFPVDWAGQTVLDGVGFDATFTGDAWEITIFAG